MAKADVWTKEMKVRGHDCVAICDGNVSHPQQVGRLLAFAVKGQTNWWQHRDYRKKN